jgi:trigger factor
MQITETTAEGLKHELTVIIPADDIERRMQDRLAEINRSIRLPGFRPGKVPIGVLRKRYGTSLLGEVLERTVSDSSAEAMRERNLRPALQPKVEIVSFGEGTDLQYKMAIEVLPEIQPMNFAELKLERLKAAIADEEIDSALDRIAKQQRKSEPVDRAAAQGDIVVIDFVGTLDGTPFPGGAGSDYSLELGSKSFIPGFEDQLVGAKAGEVRSVEVTFPADYATTELAGRASQFAVTVKQVRALAPQPLDETLAEAVGMDSLAELRKAVRERIEREYDSVARQKLKRQVLDRLAERHQFAVPQGMVDLEFDSIWKQFEAERANAAGNVPEGAAAAEAPDATAKPPEDAGDEAVKAEYRAIAERRVRLGLLLSEVGRTNNLTVTQDEVNRALGEQARRFPGEERKVVDYYRNNPQALDALRAPIYEDKVIDFILEVAEVNNRSIPGPELLAEAAKEDEPPTAP